MSTVKSDILEVKCGPGNVLGGWSEGRGRD